MLIALSANSLASLMKGPKALTLLDLPKFTREELGIAGLNLTTRHLSGVDPASQERLRDLGDRVGCPILLLSEHEAHPLGSEDDAAAEAALERMERVVRVAHRLGCSAVSLTIRDPGGEPGLDLAVSRMKDLLLKAERLEMNVLLGASATGPLAKPDQLTQLVRKIGGFRIGSFPDFECAAAFTPDAAVVVEKKGKVKAEGPAPTPMVAYLRALTPYSSAVAAAFRDFSAKGEHKPFDFSACLAAVHSVGFEGNLSLEYRGSGDPLPSVRHAKAQAELLLQPEQP
ncbi:MAG: hypothetical protein IBJ11_06835 [Phycisphaerales bacterium]|nr:hypothetical protein [Phycisphaerales bacterium]